ncbi:putative serine protease PepD [Nakamurella panacisegetis]|uniref:Putative serine protease PepD n=1 Tax=Nakamurella panacisegetis TaxID=1090615 RepID=A0A1H0SLI4_9ACTN|nr:trypsin-like peptidase domain-containing protein [Nakamurella panacisegetis]SDP42593.1 putative serine protease PepD [Nakamurella panacisegetis]
MTPPPADPTANGRPTLAPRPLWRPIVDPAQSAAFGRPAGVPSSFHPLGSRPPGPALPTGPAVPEMLADAFGRPAGGGPTLGRAPEDPPTVESARPPSDPWRDPEASVRLGEPALTRPRPEIVEQPPVERFTLRQALFDRRIRPGGLVLLLVAALVIGGVGAAIGVWAGGRLPALSTDPTFQIAGSSAAVDRAPGSVAQVAAKVTPAVVSIEVREGDTGDTGSGVVIDGKGYILTNNHVISLAATDKAAQLTVVYSTGQRVPGTIVGRDPESDLAVIKANVSGATVATLGDSSKVLVGDSVIAIGSPLGLSGTVTTGIVSALDRPVRLSGGGTDTNAVIDAVQTDASINPGNSGGALVDSTGAVIGINSAIRTLGGDSSGSIGLGFAIPINYAKSVAQELIRTGKVVHSTIGVNAKSATDGATDGAQVQNVVDGGPAAKAGIEEGDVITKVGARAVGSADDLVVAVQAHEPGQSVPVVLTRGGKTLTVQVVLAAE